MTLRSLTKDKPASSEFTDDDAWGLIPESLLGSYIANYDGVFEALGSGAIA
jgi:hypothetical protein